MPVDAEALGALVEVVARDPTNVALRRLLAELYLDHGAPADAERAFKEAIRHAPAREDLKLGLARALRAQGQNDAALAILESHLHTGDPSPAARIQLARLLLAAGHSDRAATQYRHAVDEDASVADAFLARRLTMLRAEDARLRRATFAWAGGLGVPILSNVALLAVFEPGSRPVAVAAVLFVVYILAVAATSWFASYVAIQGVKS